jgi:hypothetical protein
MPTLPAPEGGLRYLVAPPGNVLRTRPLKPYSALACDFLNALSVQLLSDSDTRAFPDVVAFAYWCRKAQIAKLKNEFKEPHARLGRGLVFHIAPANVPVNFAFSYAFALLAGNASIVRLPREDFPQVEQICRAFLTLAASVEFADIATMSAFVQYPHDERLNGLFSSLCQARIIWGGDLAIKTIRQQPVPERAVDIAFADRYSFCAIDGAKVLAADEATLVKLAEGFYNDVYLMGQNACSSPHLLVWLGGAELAQAKQLFWQAVTAATTARLDLQLVHAVDKFTLLCQNAIDVPELGAAHLHGNALYRMDLHTLPDSVDQLRGKFGMIYEYTTPALADVANIINSKYQTMTYFGLDRATCLDFVVGQRLSGIDRIVPIGSALDIGVIWDGYDLVRNLSRIIDFK